MSAKDPLDKAELLTKTQHSWDDFNAFLTTFTEAQLNTSTDANGWTAKDHLIHISVWEDSVYLLLTSQNRWQHMGTGIDEKMYRSGNFDQMNAITRLVYKDKPVAEVLKMLRDTHYRLIEKVQSMSEEELRQPYSYFQPEATLSDPAIRWFMTTLDHYVEHKLWIAAIAGSSH